VYVYIYIFQASLPDIGRESLFFILLYIMDLVTAERLLVYSYINNNTNTLALARNIQVKNVVPYVIVKVCDKDLK
jgi:hypothetical protein